MSAKSNRPQTTTEADKGDTFLTDMLFKKGTPSKPAKPGKPPASKGPRAQSELKKKPQQTQSEVDSDEYNDMVFDIDESRQLVQMADDFLSNKPLAITEGLSTVSEEGNRSTNSANRNFVSQNKRQTAFNGLRTKFACDRLDSEQRARLDSMVKEIEDNLDEVVLEK